LFSNDVLHTHCETCIHKPVVHHQLDVRDDITASLRS
jgi:hypothetical protein